VSAEKRKLRSKHAAASTDVEYMHDVPCYCAQPDGDDTV
jgi:hypothetical protein